MEQQTKEIYIFDFDGTLFKKNAIGTLIKFMFAYYGIVRFILWYCLLWLKSPYIIFLHKHDSTKFNRYLYSFYKGVRRQDFVNITNKVIIPYYRDNLYLAGLMRFNDSGLIFIVSAGIDVFLYPFFHRLDISEQNIYCNKLEFDTNEVCTGQISGSIVDYEYKAVCVNQIKSNLKLKFPNDNLYYNVFGDSKWDLPMLKLADKAIVVNPSKKLSKLIIQNISNYTFEFFDICPFGHSAIGYFINKQIFSRVFVKHIFGDKIVADLNNGSPGIILSNHQSYLDHFCLSRITNSDNYCFLGKIEHFQGGLSKWYHCLARCIPIDRNSKETSRPSFQIASLAIKLGLNVILYPEGTRTSDGNLHEFRYGFINILRYIGKPMNITCVTINDTYKLLPKGKIFFNPLRSNVSVTVFKPFIADPTTHPTEIVAKCYNIINSGLEVKN